MEMEFAVGSCALLVGILDDVVEIDLVEAVKKLEGIEYFHGGRQKIVACHWFALVCLCCIFLWVIFY